VNKTRQFHTTGKLCSRTPPPGKGPKVPTPPVSSKQNPTPTKTVRTCIYPPDPISYFPEQAVQPIRAHAPNQNRAPKAAESRDTGHRVCAPRASSAPKYSTLDDRQSHRSPPHGQFNFRPWVQAPLGTSLPRATAVAPSGQVACMEQNKNECGSKWPPPLMRSLLSSSHVIKRASLTVSPGIPIIIANQCSGVHHLCGVVTIRASASSPACAQDPITRTQVPSPTSPAMAGLAVVFSAGRWLPRRSAHSNPLCNGRGIPTCSFIRGGMLG
jgi:hypothetical protein